MSTTHEAGLAHASGALRGPSWLRPPSDPNALVARLWSRTAHKVDGELHVGGLSVPELAANVNTPAYVLDEADLRARARSFRDAFAGYDVYYAGKAFLCTTVARWVAEEGLSLDVCSDGELTVALRAGFADQSHFSRVFKRTTGRTPPTKRSRCDTFHRRAES